MFAFLPSNTALYRYERERLAFKKFLSRQFQRAEIAKDVFWQKSQKGDDAPLKKILRGVISRGLNKRHKGQSSKETVTVSKKKCNGAIIPYFKCQLKGYGQDY